MEIGSYTLQILDLLIEAVIASSVLGIGADGYKTIFCNDQLAHKIHQNIKLFNIYSYCMAD